MYYTHHFAHQETLRRACDWLGELGYRPWEIEPRIGGLPLIGMTIDAGRLGEVELLINALESTDPKGWPSFWDEAKLPHTSPGAPAHGSPADGTTKRPSPVGWHPIDTGPSMTAELDLIRDIMGR